MTAVMAGPFSDEQKQSALSSFGLVDAAQAKQQAEEQLQTSRSRTDTSSFSWTFTDPMLPKQRRLVSKCALEVSMTANPTSLGLRRRRGRIPTTIVAASTSVPIRRRLIPIQLEAPPSDTFEEPDEHDDCCAACGANSLPMVPCDTCELVFHPSCVRPALPAVPGADSAWRCPRCARQTAVRMAPTSQADLRATANNCNMALSRVTDRFKAYDAARNDRIRDSDAQCDKMRKLERKLEEKSDETEEAIRRTRQRTAETAQATKRVREAISDMISHAKRVCM